MAPLHARVVCKSIERIAAHIDDPVRRLRFLNAVAPAPGPRRRRIRLRRPWLLVLVLLALPICALFLLRSLARGTEAPHVPHPPNRAALNGLRHPVSEVWLVDKTAESEVYSNGLRVDNRYSIANHPRRYLAFPRDLRGGGAPVERTAPVGIVFHTTESRLAPFDPSENSELKRIGKSLLEYVRGKRAYNFLIDRFGRVYRIVPEDQAANHAGYSIWGDDRWMYLNLNGSFLGISFESQTLPGQTEGQFSPAQEHAGAVLVEMLRGRFAIRPENCVTHAQVSVNPHNMRIGYHTDWASGFPFERLGLPDNYGREPPALWAFGFESDPAYRDTAGKRIFPAILAAEEHFRRNAEETGARISSYRKSLQSRYRDWLREARVASGTDEEAGN